jgi:hypothetical protein
MGYHTAYMSAGLGSGISGGRANQTATAATIGNTRSAAIAGV